MKCYKIIPANSVMLHHISNKVIIRDSTLREGLQIPGVSISFKDKIRLIRLMDKMCIPEVEIGIPEGLDASINIAEYIYKNKFSLKTTALVPCYTQGWRQQLDNAARHHFYHVDIITPTSGFLLRDYELYKIKKSQISNHITECIVYAKNLGLDAGVGFIDATRTDTNLLLRLSKEASKAGASRVIVYDTVGISLPHFTFNLISQIRKATDMAIFMHCHNDYGLATANSLAGFSAGAKGIDVSINGLGGRSGNAALEEVVLALENLYRVNTGINLLSIKKLSSLTERITGIKCFPLKPIVGDYSFVHIPLMHIRCMAKGNTDTFEPFDPGQVGNERRYAFFLPLDYKKAIEPFLEKLGIQPSEGKINKILKTLKQKRFAYGLTEKQIINIIRKLVR